MARIFDEELKELQGEVLKVSALVEESIHKSVESLKEGNSDLANEVIESDKKIDSLELEVDERSLDLIARRQPVARDLRFITMAMQIVTDLERIADLAVDIAQRVLEVSDEPVIKPLVDIPKLAILAQNMVRDSVEAFVKKDAKLAKEVILKEPQADSLRNAVQKELVYGYMAKDGSTAPRAVPLLLIARHLERMCDHATNICEDVIYMVEGEVIKHHLDKLYE